MNPIFVELSGLCRYLRFGPDGNVPYEDRIHFVIFAFENEEQLDYEHMSNLLAGCTEGFQSMLPKGWVYEDTFKLSLIRGTVTREEAMGKGYTLFNQQRG